MEVASNDVATVTTDELVSKSYDQVDLYADVDDNPNFDSTTTTNGKEEDRRNSDDRSRNNSNGDAQPNDDVANEDGVELSANIDESGLYDDVMAAPSNPGSVSAATNNVDHTNSHNENDDYEDKHHHPDHTGHHDSYNRSAYNNRTNSTSGSENNTGQRRVSCYVGNLTWWVTDKDVSDACNSLGITDLVEVKFYENKINGQSKGFCSVTVGSDQSLRTVTEKLPKMTIKGSEPMVTQFTRYYYNQFEEYARKTMPNQGNASQNNGTSGNNGSSSGNGGAPYGYDAGNFNNDRGSRAYGNGVQSGGMSTGSMSLVGGAAPRQQSTAYNSGPRPNMPGQQQSNNSYSSRNNIPNSVGMNNNGPMRSSGQSMYSGGSTSGPYGQRGLMGNGAGQIMGQSGPMRSYPPSNPSIQPPSLLPNSGALLNNPASRGMPSTGMNNAWDRSNSPMMSNYPNNNQNGLIQSVPNPSMIMGQQRPMGMPGMPNAMSNAAVGYNYGAGPQNAALLAQPMMSQPYGTPGVNSYAQAAPLLMQKHQMPMQQTQQPGLQQAYMTQDPYYASRMVAGTQSQPTPLLMPPPSSSGSPHTGNQPISDAEFQDILEKNRIISGSAISRAVHDATNGQFQAAIETLATAISLIRQSKISHDERCQLFLNTLLDTQKGIEDKYYGPSSHPSSSTTRSSNRSPDGRDRERTKRSRSRESRDRRSSRDRDSNRGRDRRGGDRHHHKSSHRDRSRGRDRSRDRSSPVSHRSRH